MRKLLSCYIVLSLLCFFNLPCVLSQAQGPVSAPSPTGGLNKTTGLIDSLEFREVDIKDVLRQLAKQYDLNIVFSESVSGLVTVQLKNVTIDEALEAIITINGFVYTKKGGVFKVTTAEEAEKEGKQTRVFRLNNADATLLRASLAKVISADGSVEVDARSNSLIVTDVPRIVNEVEEMIKNNLDTMTQQVLIEARFIEVSVGTTEKIGVDWSPVSSTSPMISTTGSKRATTAPFESSVAADALRNVIPEANPNLVGTAADSVYPSSQSFPYIDESSSGVAATDAFSFGTLDFSNLQIALNFLKNRSDAKVISSPRIVTVDNKEARIQVGETRRIRSSEEIDTTAANPVTTYTYEKTDIGIILVVTPHVTLDGHIRLSLQPEVSSADAVDENNINIINKRVAQTEVIIKDGQTIVIGGLIENKKTEATSKIPVLGDIPLLGKMFSHKTINPDSQKELLIFVTARILDEKEKGAIGYKSGIITSPPRPLKMELKDINLKDEDEPVKK